MVKGVTTSGLEFEVDENRVNDMEVIDLMADLSDSEAGSVDMAKLSALIRKVLSPEMKKKLYDHVRTPDGRAPIDAVSKTFFEMLSYDGETKNS